ncbi:MAG: helix-turn-helix transcriptional regulator [Lachnospiraceae bacterium]|uniref:helix-turn-helix transcriptional regulator n=1 Tax=Falcatimonas sp. MSJ-15 TaxID=2841515 RepID=UPI001C0F65FF|nr:helix-turn-helix transcriptional regulator [Falcatimonas sp. MSJ-15]MBQ5734035.1 helix-turn-helix transcriptional regulator [Lachnospiraceae bacterium]MBU5469871.1 helix-turn-helix domain-containing protein [Falcatimonas sp. MSJ-15]MEE0958532.1 helix-turn-helix transcriptional regulator [Lachnospiraceae bacterium]
MNKEEKRTIGKVIKDKRIGLGMTQEELCKNICTKKHLSNIENDRCDPSTYIVKKLFERMGESAVHNIIDL